MKKLQAIITIIRLPNLVFIFLTQLLVYRNLIAKPMASKEIIPILNLQDAILLAISTTLIAAGGYIINDYFDIKIDEINKPEKVTVELQFKRRYVMLAHIALDVVALLLVYPLAQKAGHISLLGIQLFTIAILVLYSAYLKRKPFSGNLTVAVLTALTVLLPALYNYPIFGFYTKVIILSIAFFAFVLTLMREVIKDIEDIKGDAVDGCNTLPIAKGIQFCKTLLYSIVIVFFEFWMFAGYNMLTTFAWLNVFVLLIPVMIGLVLFGVWLKKANEQKHFSRLSTLLKIITFIGILQIYFI
jgi:4-hydroxybenzoate polyprenyltransferase